MSKHRTLDPILFIGRTLQLACVLLLLLMVLAAFYTGAVASGIVLLAATGLGVAFAERAEKVEQLRVELHRSERRADDALHQARMVRAQLTVERVQR